MRMKIKSSIKKLFGSRRTGSRFLLHIPLFYSGFPAPSWVLGGTCIQYRAVAGKSQGGSVDKFFSTIFFDLLRRARLCFAGGSVK